MWPGAVIKSALTLLGSLHIRFESAKFLTDDVGHRGRQFFLKSLKELSNTIWIKYSIRNQNGSFFVIECWLLLPIIDSLVTEAFFFAPNEHVLIDIFIVVQLKSRN